MRRLLLALLACLPLSAQAAITFVACADNSVSNNIDITVNKPTGTQDGDVLVFLYGNNSSDSTAVAVTGATQIDYVDGGGSTDYIGYKVASSEGASYTFDQTSGTAQATSAAICAFRGVDTGTPFDVTYVRATHFAHIANDTSPTPAAITTVTNGAWVISTAHGTGDTATTDFTSSTNYDERQQRISNNRHLYLQTREIATAGAQTIGDITPTSASAGADWDLFTIALKPAAAGCVGAPVLNDVDEDDAITSTQQNVSIDGTNLCDSGTVTLEQGATVKTLSQDSYADTEAVVDISGAGPGVASGLLFGAANVCVENEAEEQDCQAVTITPPSGTIFEDLTSAVALQWDAYGAPNRPYGLPNDLQDDSQLALRNAVGCTIGTDVTINLDGSLDVDDACTALDWDFSRDGLYVGTVETLSFGGLPPLFGPIDVPSRVDTLDLAITPFDVSGYFVEGDGTIDTYAMQQWTTSTNRTLVNGAVTASLTVTVDAVTNLVPGDYITCDAGAHNVRVKYVDPFTPALGLWEEVTCSDNAQIAERGVGAGSVSGYTLDSGTGSLTATPDTIATTADLFYRATDDASLDADSNGFSVEVSAFTDTVQVGGFTFDTNGRLLTHFLTDLEDVPAGAVFVAGIAYDPTTGARYVAEFPSDEDVQYHGGSAIRADGAQTIATGAVETEFGGFGFTQRGELIVTTSNPTTFFNIFGFVDSKLSVTDAN